MRPCRRHGHSPGVSPTGHLSEPDHRRARCRPRRRGGHGVQYSQPTLRRRLLDDGLVRSRHHPPFRITGARTVPSKTRHDHAAGTSRLHQTPGWNSAILRQTRQGFAHAANTRLPALAVRPAPHCAIYTYRRRRWRSDRPACVPGHASRVAAVGVVRQGHDPHRLESTQPGAHRVCRCVLQRRITRARRADFAPGSYRSPQPP